MNPKLHAKHASIQGGEGCGENSSYSPGSPPPPESVQHFQQLMAQDAPHVHSDMTKEGKGILFNKNMTSNIIGAMKDQDAIFMGNVQRMYDNYKNSSS